jgi:hypothetical protein
MADPRYTDQHTDQRPFPETNAPLDTDTNRSSSTIWGWTAAIVASIVIIGLIIAYDRSDIVANNSPSTTPTTSGSAPAAPRPMAPSSNPTQANPAPAPAAPSSNPAPN